MSQLQKEAWRQPLRDINRDVTAVREAKVQLTRRCQVSRRQNKRREGETELETADRYATAMCTWLTRVCAMCPVSCILYIIETQRSNSPSAECGISVNQELAWYVELV